MTGPNLEGQVQVREKCPGPGPDRTSDSLIPSLSLLSAHHISSFSLLATQPTSLFTASSSDHFIFTANPSAHLVSTASSSGLLAFAASSMIFPRFINFETRLIRKMSNPSLVSL